MILLDFDGTIYQGRYVDRFTADVAPDAETIAHVQQYRDAYGEQVVIFTARLSECSVRERFRIIGAIQNWTAKHWNGWRPEATEIKHPGVIIDNHAFGFRGRWPSVAMLREIHGGKAFTSAADYVEGAA